MKSITKSKIIILITLGILFSFSPIITANFSANINVNKENLNPSKISVKIHINGNSGWLAFRNAGNCTGDGNYTNPYVIEDLVIDGRGLGSCIWIENSDVYFRIENCTLFNSGGNPHDAGIKLVQINNGQLIDNNCSFNGGDGIFLDWSDNITVFGNTANNNNYGGIMLNVFNNYNLISGNTANNNEGGGIFVGGYCDNNTVLGNTVNDNNHGIINLANSDNNTYFGNTLNNNNKGGIALYSYNLTLSGNILNNCGVILYGDSVELSSYNIDNTNLVNGKPLYYYSNEINLRSDNFTNAGQVILVSCNGSLISNLNASFCTQGISLHYCYNNNITENDLTYNSIAGLYLEFSDNNTITGNVANNNDKGIYLVVSNKNLVTRNTANDNNIGIHLSYTNNNIITGNILLGNDECIVEENSEGNIFENNDCGEGGGFPVELIILISIIGAGIVIGITTPLLIRRKRKRIP
ncbi:MAG: nitrous oxide reductase family maturation protein NosD [Promethearchaeota archaeon]